MTISNVLPDSIADWHFDLVIIGSGFGSTFFLHEALRVRPMRILVLEWGSFNSHDWQIQSGRNTPIADEETYSTDTPEKPWNFTIGFGGGTNCWFAQTPRMHPSDFAIHSRYGVGQDWPISYDDLEPFYGEAEAIMSISGDPDMALIMPRSTPFPQPPHRPSTPDRMMKAAQPDLHFIMPTARARQATSNRAACCASLRCRICPADAKFTVTNELSELFSSPQVTLCLGAEVRALEHAGSAVQAATFRAQGKDYRVTGDIFVLGANAIHSPAILIRSDLGEGKVGRGLHESYGWSVEAYLGGVNNFGGSTISTGLNFGLYDGDHRSDQAAALVYFDNRWSHGLRPEPGKMRQTLPIVIVTEDLLEDKNHVALDADGNAFVHYAGAADYAVRGMVRAKDKLADLLAPLPVEAIFDRGIRPTESHLQGTLRMGRDPATSVIDAAMVHHRLRNLVVVGTSAFPSCSCANPSLTAAALSLRAARVLFGGPTE